MNKGSQYRTSLQAATVDSTAVRARQTQPKAAAVVFNQLRRKAWAHERSPDGKDEWLTPPWIIQKLGKFDLDPCAPINPPWSTAAHHYSILDDGLTAPWTGRVWMNPPYGRSTGPWMRRLVRHGNGIALIFARTETKLFFEYVWGFGGCGLVPARSIKVLPCGREASCKLGWRTFVFGGLWRLQRRGAAIEWNPREADRSGPAFFKQYQHALSRTEAASCC